jgi:hypothetical protein
MTLQDAIRVLFACGLDEVLELMRDRIKAGEFGPAPVLAADHSKYRECKEAIAVLRSAVGPGNSTNDPIHLPGARL